MIFWYCRYKISLQRKTFTTIDFKGWQCSAVSIFCHIRSRQTSLTRLQNVRFQLVTQWHELIVWEQYRVALSLHQSITCIFFPRHVCPCAALCALAASSSSSKVIRAKSASRRARCTAEREAPAPKDLPKGRTWKTIYRATHLVSENLSLTWVLGIPLSCFGSK